MGPAHSCFDHQRWLGTDYYEGYNFSVWHGLTLTASSIALRLGYASVGRGCFHAPVCPIHAYMIIDGMRVRLPDVYMCHAAGIAGAPRTCW